MNHRFDGKFEVQDESANELWGEFALFMMDRGFKSAEKSRCFTRNTFILCIGNVEVHGFVGEDGGLKLMVVAPVARAKSPYDFYYEKGIGFYTYSRFSVHSSEDFETVAGDVLSLTCIAENIIRENKGALRSRGASGIARAVSSAEHGGGANAEGAYPTAFTRSSWGVFKYGFVSGTAMSSGFVLALRMTGLGAEKLPNLFRLIDSYNDLVHRVLADPNSASFVERITVPLSVLVGTCMASGVGAGGSLVLIRYLIGKAMSDGGGSE